MADLGLEFCSLVASVALEHALRSEVVGQGSKIAVLLRPDPAVVSNGREVVRVVGPGAGVVLVEFDRRFHWHTFTEEPTEWAEVAQDLAQLASAYFAGAGRIERHRGWFRNREWLVVPAGDSLYRLLRDEGKRTASPERHG